MSTADKKEVSLPEKFKWAYFDYASPSPEAQNKCLVTLIQIVSLAVCGVEICVGSYTAYSLYKY